MPFEQLQKERSREFIARSRKEVYFPAKDVLAAMVRTNKKKQSPEYKLAEAIAKGDTSKLPADVVAIGANGEVQLKISAIVHRGLSAFQKLNQVPGATALFEAIDKDMLLAGKDCPRIRKFREKRWEAAEAGMRDMRKCAMDYVDQEIEIAGRGSRHAFESQAEARAYREITNYAQGIVNKLFACAGLKQFQPKVLLTRDREPNAFVFSMGNNEALKEYFDNASRSKTAPELPIYINIGLFFQDYNEDALAGILAHEFSHLLQPKYLGARDRNTSQRLEYDADRSALYLADAAGYNPREYIDLFSGQTIKTPFLDKLGFGSHPDRQKRFIELEKEFNRADLPFPNGSNNAKYPPAEIKNAILELKKLYEKIDTKPAADIGKTLYEEERQGTVEHYIRNQSGNELFFSSDFFEALQRIGRKRKEREMLRQELAHGTLGRRDNLFADMATFLASLEILHQPQKPGVSYSHHITLPEHIGSADREILDIQKQERYLKNQESFESLVVSKNEPEYRRKQLLAELELDNQDRKTQTIDDWLDDTNRDAAVFWNFVEQKLGWDKTNRKITPGEKLWCINYWLEQSMFDNPNAGLSKIFSVLRVRTETTKQTVNIAATSKHESEGLLKYTPLLARAQRRETPASSNTEATIDKTADTVEPLFFVFPGHIRLQYMPVPEDPDSEPEIVREMAQATLQKIIENYAQLLAKDGLENVSPEVLNYILARIIPNNNGTLNIDFLTNPAQASFPFMEQVLAVLEQKSLKNIFRKTGAPLTPGREAQNRLRERALVFLAFAVLPGNKDQANKQQGYRRRLEHDINLQRHQMVSWEVAKRNSKPRHGIIIS